MVAFGVSNRVDTAMRTLIDPLARPAGTRAWVTTGWPAAIDVGRAFARSALAGRPVRSSSWSRTAPALKSAIIFSESARTRPGTACGAGGRQRA